MLESSLTFSPIRRLLDCIRSREISAVEILRLVLDRIEELDPTLNAYLCTNAKALEEAERADIALKRGQLLGPLHGLPVSLKDLILTASMPTTAGSRAPLSSWRTKTDVDAPLVARLKKAGAILVGKNSLHEFAFGVTSENEHFGPVLNPWNTGRMAGGSSGGSAAAVAAGMAYASIGTDTRGSIRIPSAFCGVVGLKPTRRLVSTRGVFPLSWTLDHAGPIARTVDDVAILHSILAGAGKAPSTEHSEVVNASSLKAAFCPYYFERLDPEVASAVENAISTLESAGVQVEEIQMESLKSALWASDIISRAEAATIHESLLRNTPESYGPLVRKRLLSGFEVTGPELIKAMRLRRKAISEFSRVFQRVDCLIAPAVPVPAPSLGTQELNPSGREVETVVQCFVRLNAPQNVAGVPALVLPCGFTGTGLPIGLQLIADRFREDRLFAVGSLFERLAGWHEKHPPFP